MLQMVQYCHELLGSFYVLSENISTLNLSTQVQLKYKVRHTNWTIIVTIVRPTLIICVAFTILLVQPALGTTTRCNLVVTNTLSSNDIQENDFQRKVQDLMSLRTCPKKFLMYRILYYIERFVADWFWTTIRTSTDSW